MRKRNIAMDKASHINPPTLPTFAAMSSGDSSPVAPKMSKSRTRSGNGGGFHGNKISGGNQITGGQNQFNQGRGSKSRTTFQRTASQEDNEEESTEEEDASQESSSESEEDEEEEIIRLQLRLAELKKKKKAKKALASRGQVLGAAPLALPPVPATVESRAAAATLNASRYAKRT
ncbi:hypothetical protein BKA70DRAFT_1285443 [Coprinopsis sp. MPI-PUGE-AT-0042]|nr:hypothetical protein BKA70DRAFT_1285443 [Coprinopsis sp. MPI-PUGE-AT-0042]